MLIISLDRQKLFSIYACSFLIVKLANYIFELLSLYLHTFGSFLFIYVLKVLGDICHWHIKGRCCFSYYQPWCLNSSLFSPNYLIILNFGMCINEIYWYDNTSVVQFCTKEPDVGTYSACSSVVRWCWDLVCCFTGSPHMAWVP